MEVLSSGMLVDIDRRDMAIWEATPDGEFSVKSAYDLLVNEDSSNSNTQSWITIWKWPGTQRARIFFWKVMNGDLITNGYRRSRDMASSSLYPLCGSHDETTLHILRDCYLVDELWGKCLGGAIIQGWAKCLVM